MRIILMLGVLSFVGLGSAGAQTPVRTGDDANAAGDTAKARQISGGVLNGKATSLPKPPYPAAARAVGASGAVTVQVLIDENGDVVSAEAVSGHPLLRAAAAQAARGAKFSPTYLEGTPVKVSGVITYNFVGPLTLARLSFILTHAERTQSFRYATPAALSSQLSAEWTQEKQMLESLTFEEERVVSPKVEETKAPQPPNMDANKATSATKDTNRYTVIGNRATFSAASHGRSPKLDAASLVSLRSLIGLFEARASANEHAAWTFELGSMLGAFIAEMHDEARTASNIAKIDALADRAPSSVQQGSAQSVKRFVEMYRTEGIRDENRHSLIEKAEMLSNLRY